MSTLKQDGDQAAAGAAAAAVGAIAGAVGLELAGEAEPVPDDIAQMAVDRTAARAAKDYAKADELRDLMTAAGWTVEDSPDGPVVRPLG